MPLLPQPPYRTRFVGGPLHGRETLERELPMLWARHFRGRDGSWGMADYDAYMCVDGVWLYRHVERVERTPVGGYVHRHAGE